MDDHQLFIDLLTARLEMENSLEIVGKSSHAAQALNEIGKLRPNITLLDISMPDMSGIELTKLIKKYSPSTKVIGVSMHSELAYIKSMINNGASGYLTKTSSLEEILNAINEVAVGKKYICESVRKLLAENALFKTEEENLPRSKSLSMREIEIVKLVRRGLTSLEIGKALNISSKTVDVHRYHIMKKLGVKNAIELIFVTNNQLL